MPIVDALNLLLALRRVPLLRPTAHLHLQPINSVNSIKPTRPIAAATPATPATAATPSTSHTLDPAPSHASSHHSASPAIATVDPIPPQPQSQSQPQSQPRSAPLQSQTEPLAAEPTPVDDSFFQIDHSANEKQLEPAAVPRTRFGRLYQFGTLAAGVGMGMMTEAAKRAVGLSDTTTNLAFSGQNAELIVKRLSKMRGAALKLGQMVSIQDNKFLPPEVDAVFRRVQDSANYMPKWQLEQVLASELGSEWRSNFDEFGMTPVAAASIGQVHKARLPSGEIVAVKVQYPGVADSITSDLANLKSIMMFGDMLPRGLYLDNTIRVAAVELARECDYNHEADAYERFKSLIQESGVDGFYVPKVFRELSTSKVLTTEFVPGIAVDKVATLSQDDRNRLGERLFKLCMLELFTFRFMQTDPNWSNFLYDVNKRQINLIDFGASREFPKSFTDGYLKLLHASSIGDVKGCIDYSRELNFLTGYESEALNNAHVKSLRLLSLPFLKDAPDYYDFRAGSDITEQVRSEIPLMLRERLSPPPDESYSLHRKLSGCFLLCTKLGSQIPCKRIFQETYRAYQF